MLHHFIYNYFTLILKLDHHIQFNYLFLYLILIYKHFLIQLINLVYMIIYPIILYDVLLNNVLYVDMLMHYIILYQNHLIFNSNHFHSFLYINHFSKYILNQYFILISIQILINYYNIFLFSNLVFLHILW